MNVQETYKLIALLNRLWPNFTPVEGIAEAWQAILDDVDLGQATAAVKAMAASGDYDWAPVPGKIRKVVLDEPDVEELAGAAWEAVLDVARYKSIQRASEFIVDPAALQAVSGIGGWNVLVNQTDQTRSSNRARFLDVYKAIKGRMLRGDAYQEALQATQGDNKRIGGGPERIAGWPS